MTDSDPAVYVKHVADMLVASIRFQGDTGQIPAHLKQLQEHGGIEPAGDPVVLIHEGTGGESLDIEVCLPANQPVNAGPIHSHTIAGGHMVCRIYHGNRVDGNINSLDAAWPAFYQHLLGSGIELEHGAAREVILASQDGQDPGSQPSHTELQTPVLLPRWLDSLSTGLDAAAGEQTRREIMAGSEALSVDSPPQEKGAWTRQAMQRLEGAVQDEKTRHGIMAACAHRFPERRIADLRAKYHELGSIDELLEHMCNDSSYGGVSFYSKPRSDGNRILVTKMPCDMKGYVTAKTPEQKRASYCHCGLVRALILAGETASSTFCYCGSGWFSQLWEGILGQPVEVEVLSSVLQGDDDCTFAIHLPEGLEG